ncbi:hypothetical protein AAVH_42574 [Aphelenchoides avenae]|nr:hypothetical protein AAVH_42574 [Aphelenchus avenae]
MFQVRYYGYNRYNYFKSPRYYNSPFAVLRYWYNSAFPFRYSKDYNPSYTNYHRHLFGRVLQADRSKSLFVNDKSPYGLHHGTYDRLDRNPYFPHGPYVIDRKCP